MRFILGFIFFGILFYAIWYFFPETFTTLVNWAGNVFHFFRDLVENLITKFHGMQETPVKESIPATLSFIVTRFIK